MTEDLRTVIEGTLHTVDGRGLVRIKSRYKTDINDLWEALTDHQRLARWYGRVEGDLRVGGEFTAFVHGSHWEGRGRVNVCNPPQQLQVTTFEEGSPEKVVTAELVADGDHTVLNIEVRDIPLNQLSAHGAGWQLHVDDLSAYLAGQEGLDFGTAWLARWQELIKSYGEVAVVPLAP